MIEVREHGGSGPVVVVIHGGPGARGSAGPVARGLADSFRVIEPWQRISGDGALTVACHIADLHEIDLGSEYPHHALHGDRLELGFETQPGPDAPEMHIGDRGDPFNGEVRAGLPPLIDIGAPTGQGGTEGTPGIALHHLRELVFEGPVGVLG